jgi:AcrR family transcriptional regulator
MTYLSEGKQSARFLESSAVTFRKSGRPREDRPARRQEIYEAVCPLILAHGVHGFTMQEAAYAACLSVGALYYYFPSKRELVLHGVQPETIQRYCHLNRRAFEHLAVQDPARFYDLFINRFIDGVLMTRPAMLAAIELGATEMQAALAWIRGATTGTDSELSKALRLVAPALDELAFQGLLNATRRIILGAVVDANVTREECRSELEALFQWYVHGAPGSRDRSLSAVAAY